jgi:hypothetical protein
LSIIGLGTLGITDVRVQGSTLYLCGVDMYEWTDPSVQSSIAYCNFGNGIECNVIPTNFKCDEFEVSEEGAIIVVEYDTAGKDFLLLKINL